LQLQAYQPSKARQSCVSPTIPCVSKNGHTGVELVELPVEMTKAEAVQHLKSVGFGQGDAAVEAAIAYAEKKNPAPVAVKATAKKAETVTA